MIAEIHNLVAPFLILGIHWPRKNKNPKRAKRGVAIGRGAVKTGVSSLVSLSIRATYVIRTPVSVSGATSKAGMTLYAMQHRVDFGILNIESKTMCYLADVSISRYRHSARQARGEFSYRSRIPGRWVLWRMLYFVIVIYALRQEGMVSF